jgi:NAD(P)-dependent dehydrogenase (short-subunit alcohol dehydrogenase family)
MDAARMAKRFDGSAALITGGTGALGLAVVGAFLAEGASVAVPYRSQEGADSLRARVGALASRLAFFRADITDEVSVGEMVDAVVERFGAVDILANIAGGFRGGVHVSDLPTETWNAMLDLNLRSVFYVCRAVLPHMKTRKRGKIITVSSRAGLSGVAGMSAYSVSKAGVRVLTESIAAEVLHDGIRANCILPSIIDTAANRTAMSKADFSRWATPEEIARVVLFLASDEAAVISGAAIPVYGRA